MMGYYRTMERKAAGGRTVQPYMERFSAGQQGTGSRGRQGTEGRSAKIPDIRQQGPRPQDRSRTSTRSAAAPALPSGSCAGGAEGGGRPWDF